MPPLAVALLTYSTKPRGGVVHTLAVAEALAERGHAVELLALGAPGARFFREPRVPYRIFPYGGPDRPIETKVLAMIETYAGHLEEVVARFDVVHAQDCLSASSLVSLGERIALPAFLRTVHHVDDFTSPALIECQQRSIVSPDRVLVVSGYWREQLRSEFGVDADVVPNGVDLARFGPPDAEARARAREQFGFGDRPVVLTVGGIEPRKGSIRLAEAFACRAVLGSKRPLLVIAGGETLFDYLSYRERFFARLEELGLALERDVRVLGPVDDKDLPSLYHAADAFVFPSTKEGFGLVLLEAQASGLPVVVSDLPVFREFLTDGESALFAAGDGAPALAAAIRRVLADERLRASLRAGGLAVAARFSWEASAAAHERVYREVVLGRGRAGSVVG